MRTNRALLGKQGESSARSYFEKHGCAIVDSNVRSRYGEIDLIVRKDKALRFIEVKLRRTIEYGIPQEAVVRRKQERIRTTALIWLRRRHLPMDSEIHFDVLAIREEEGTMRYDYIEDAF